MSGSGKGLLGLWLYRSGEQEWALKEGSPLHKKRDLMVNYIRHIRTRLINKFVKFEKSRAPIAQKQRKGITDAVGHLK